MFRVTPFKGVLVLGEATTLTVLVKEDDAQEHGWTSVEKINCNTVVMEMGITGPMRVECVDFGGQISLVNSFHQCL